MKRNKKRRSKLSTLVSRRISVYVGDPVRVCKSKLERKWKPCCWVVVMIFNIFLGYYVRLENCLVECLSVKVHGEHLRRADIEEWKIPSADSRKPYRRAAYVVPPQESSEESSQ